MKTILLLVLISCSSLVKAQDVTDTTSISAVSIASAPKKPAKSVLPKVAIGAAYVGTVYLVYKQADRTIQDESQEGKTAFKSGIAHTVSPLGLGSTNVIGCGLVTGFSLLTKNTRLQKASFLLIAAHLLNSVATSTLKHQFQRYRPSTGKPYNTFDGDDGPGYNQSFPSAHTSNAFTTATIFASVYKDKKWVAPFAYGVATMVGLSRIYDNAHWASDVMAGAAVGFLSAKSVILLDKVLSDRHIHIYPQIGSKHVGAAMVYQF